MSDILLINLGTGNPSKPPLGYDRTVYRFKEDGFEQETVIAGLALWKHLVHRDSSPASVRFAATREAWEGKEDAIREEADAMGLDVAVLDPPFFVEIPRSIDKLWSVLPELEEWAEQHRQDGQPPVLHMDLTHAWRAIPISQPWLALFLERIGFVRTGVMGYGAYVQDISPTPYIDLSAVMELAEWAAAVRDFERRGDAGALSQLMEAGARESRRVIFAGSPGRQDRDSLRHLGSVIKAAQAIGDYVPAGLPIELGIEARRALGRTQPKDVAGAVRSVLPPAAPVAERLHDAARRFAWPEELPGKATKTHLRLSPDEVRRELDLVKLWAQRGAEGGALRALRELIINRVLLARGVTSGWLRRDAREPASDALNALRPAKNAKYRSLPDPMKELGSLWHSVCEKRNAFAHAGMNQDEVHVEGVRRQVAEDIEKFEQLNEAGDGLWRLDGAPPELEP